MFEKHDCVLSVLSNLCWLRGQIVYVVTNKIYAYKDDVYVWQYIRLPQTQG